MVEAIVTKKARDTRSTFNSGEQELLMETIDKVQTYLHCKNYLASMRKSAKYYTSVINEAKKAKGNNPIMLKAAEANIESALKRIDKLSNELDVNSAKWSAHEIKEFTLNNSKQASNLLSDSKELIEEHLKRTVETTAMRELGRNVAESLPVVGGAVAISNAMAEYYDAVRSGKDASIERINLYIVGALIFVPAVGVAIRHGIKHSKKVAALNKLLQATPDPNIIKKADDFVKSIPENVTHNVENVRGAIVYKSESESIFDLLSKVNQNIQDVASNFHKITQIAGDASVYVIDKSGTWLLNGVDRKVGDLGLEIYFNAMKKLENKGAYVARTTMVGDEVAILGKKGFEKEINNALKESAEEVFKKYGIKDTLGLKEKCAKASILSADIVFKEGKVMYKSAGKEKLFNIDTLINDIELENSLKDITQPKKEKILSFIKKLENIRPLQKSTKPSKQSMKVVLEIENEEMLKALKDVAESNKKAMHQIGVNSIGPSMVNQLGHINADKVTATAIDALVASGRITKEEAAGIFQKAALNYSIESSEAAAKLMKLTGTEINTILGGVKVKFKFFVGTAEQIEDLVSAHMLKKMGMGSDAIKEIVPRVKDINSTVTKLHLQGEEIAPWARDALGYLYYCLGN